MATVDLWPENIAIHAGLEGPTVLLREQAALLGQKTRNLVEAEVDTHSYNSGEIVDVFRVLSRKLNYQQVLFQVQYDLEFFPASVVWSGFSKDDYSQTKDAIPSREVNSKDELKTVLQEIFSHPRTVQIVHALISRSRE